MDAILVVEDAPDTLVVYGHIIRALFDFNVYLVSDGRSAIDCLNKYGQSIKIVILDQVMLDMSGSEIIDHLINSSSHRVAIIMCTGYINQTFIEWFYSCYTENVLTIALLSKPVIMRELEDAINLAIRTLNNE